MNIIEHKAQGMIEEVYGPMAAWPEDVFILIKYSYQGKEAPLVLTNGIPVFTLKHKAQEFFDKIRGLMGGISFEVRSVHKLELRMIQKDFTHWSGIGQPMLLINPTGLKAEHGGARPGAGRPAAPANTTDKGIKVGRHSLEDRQFILAKLTPDERFQALMEAAVQKDFVDIQNEHMDNTLGQIWGESDD